MSAASSQVQRGLRGQNGQARDFSDVFCRLPALGCRYREVSHVAVDANGSAVSVAGVALIDQARLNDPKHPPGPGDDAR